ncbi:MAG: carboxypeptidase M32 [Anaerolineae bacterium]
MEHQFQELKDRLAEVYDLSAAAAVLGWDMQTYMPPGGVQSRAEQLATLQRLSHEKLTSDEIGRLLQDLRPYEASLSYDSNEASLIRVTRREYERHRRLPADFVRRMAETGAMSYQTWVEARPESDWARTESWLERILELSREYSSYFPDKQHVADPLIDIVDPGMTAAELKRTFAELRAALVPIVRAITAFPPADDSCLRQHFSGPTQLDLSQKIVAQLGYDFKRGRQDLTAHPFMTQFSIDDVRITTRVDENYLGQTLFSSIHESGHAMYGQGIDHGLARTLLADGASSGAHESQSRLWENQVGRSRGFWTYFYPRLQETFPSQLGQVPLETFYRAVNKVEQSLIRTEADEVTYNLHIMLRFDLELDMLEGKLAVHDLPEAWNERFKQDMGLTPPDYSSGPMQDIHWFGGQIGGVFQGYTLGNIMGAQFFDAAQHAHPEIPDQIAHGQFSTLLGWLQDNVYKHGAKFTPPELMQRATGGPISIAPYLHYLRTKFGELYPL